MESGNHYYPMTRDNNRLGVRKISIFRCVQMVSTFLTIMYIHWPHQT